MKLSRALALPLALLGVILLALPVAAQTTARRTNDFLNSIGVNTQVQSYGAGAPYTNGTGMITDLQFAGIRALRDGDAAATAGAQLSAMTALANAGFHWTILPTITGNASGYSFVQANRLANVKTIDNLSQPHALLAVEGFNEPNNWMPNVSGCGTSWSCTASGMAAYYSAIKADSRLGTLPVWGVTDTGAETTNVGLQFLTNGGTTYADAFNTHIYPLYNQAVGAYDPNSANLAGFIGTPDQILYQINQDFVNTYVGHFAGPSQATVLASPHVATEFGWRTSDLDARTRGVNMVNFYLDAYFVNNFQRSFGYELYDEGDGWGWFSTTGTPTSVATDLHNFTTALADSGSTAATFTPGALNFTLTGMPANSHSALLQSSNGTFLLVLWADTTNYNIVTKTPRTIATTNVGLSLVTASSIKVFDVVAGTTATQNLTNVTSATIPLSDHAVTLQITPTGVVNESPNNTVITTVGPIITDASGNTFAISSGAQILINGSVDTSTANVVELAYVNHVLWQLNTSNNWYNYLGTPGSYGGPTTVSPLSSGTGKTSPPTPLSGTVNPQTWATYDQNFSGVTLPSGKAFHFNVLPPAQRNDTAYQYPLIIWLHPDGSGNGWYDGSKTDPFFYVPNEPANYNTTAFLTKYPAVIAVPYADQTCPEGSEVCNWGGWVNNGKTGSGSVNSGDTGPNVFAIIGMINYLKTVYSIDPNRIYCEGFSLGGIGCEYLLLHYNAYNGDLGKIFTAGTSTGGVLEVNGFGVGPTSANATTMNSVPVWWFSGANDTTSKPADWNLPMWRALAGNSSYPGAITSATANKAGSSEMRFTLCSTCGHQSTDSAGNPVSVNTTIMDWMYGLTAAPAGTGHFVAAKNQFLDPNGKVFFPIGINLGQADMSTASQNANATPLLTLYPGINFVRVPVYNVNGGACCTYNPPSFFQNFVNQVTSHGIVVEFEHHVASNGGTGGGGQGVVFTGQMLTDENNWYAAMATFYKNNPYVWFGTNNEPPNSTSLSAWQRATYDAIRGTGSNAPIFMEIQGYPGCWNCGMDASQYATMTNVAWDTHFYGWVVRDASGNGYQTDQTLVNSTLAGLISDVQATKSADGVMPVGIMEYGPSTTGSTLDANGSQVINGVLASSHGSAAWHWGQQDCCNNLGAQDGSSLNAFGQQVATTIAARATQTSSETLSISTISNIAANTTFTVSGSIVGASSTPALQYQNNNGAWTTLPAGASVSQIAFSFVDPGFASPGVNNTVRVRDANSTSIVATSNTFTVTGAESANNSIVTVTLTTPSFSDNFTSLSLHRTWQAGDNWQLIAPDTPDGRGGPSFGESGDQWWTNPFNPSTPISGIYTQDSSGLHLGLLKTPAAQQSYITSTSGAALGYVGGLLNTSQTSYQKYGYWETTVAVPKVPGFTFQVDAENVQITGTWPPEIDLRISTDGSSVQTVLFEFALPGGGYTQYTTSSTAGFDATKSHTYAWDWEVDYITFYIDNVQVAQYANPGTAYTTNPMFLFMLSGANYIGNGDPSAASLPVSAQVTSINVYPTKPAATSTGSIINAIGEVWTIGSDGRVAVNGASDATTSNVVELAYVNHTVWYKNNSGLWWFKTKASDTWQPTGGTTTSPLSIVESANNTVVTTVGALITNAAGTTFAISSGAQILINGTVDTVTSNVVELAYVNHVLWQLNTSGNWYSYSGTPGSYTGPTTTSPLPTEIVSINTIAAQTTNTGFTVTGSVSGVTVAPTLQYQDNTGAWTAFPTGSSVGAPSGGFSTFSLAHPGMAAGATNTISVRDANNLAAVGSSNGFAVTSTGETLSINAIPVQSANTAFTVSGTISGIAGSSIVTNFAVNPGQDGSYWKKPFQSSASWITSGSLITALRGGTPSINVKGNFGVPWVIGTASDPLVRVTDGTKTINVHMPLGTIIETPASAFDQSIGGSDAAQPYLVWSISGASMNTTSVQASGSVITGTYGFSIQDGAGLIMVDKVTGVLGSNNSIGGIQDYELAQIQNDPNYVIPHMLAFQLDSNTQASSAGPIWPLNLTDTSNGTYAGPIPQGVTIGIPANVTMPAGKTRAYKALWDQLQRFGMENYNFGATGGVNFVIYDQSGAYASLISDLQAAWVDIGHNYLSILNYNNGASGAQYSLATTKGAIPGSTDAFPAPPPLDLSPTNGINVAPSTFGAWYPNTAYTATPTNPGASAAAPTLQYQDGAGAWQSLPAGATVTGTSFSFVHPGVATTGSNTISVRDANVPSIVATATYTITTQSSSSTAWNPSDTSATVSLSSNNTVALSGSATLGGSRSVTGRSSGKFCFEVAATTVSANLALGISNTAYALSSTLLGTSANSVGFYPAKPGSLQSILFNGVQVLRTVLSKITPTSGGSFVDSANHTWTMQADTHVYEDGNQVPGSNGTGAFAIVNGLYYGQDATSLNWFTYSTSTQTWTAAAPPTLPVASTADASGDAVTICTDLTAQKAWISTPAMRSASGIIWNSDTIANQNPATGTGGVSFGGMACPCFATFSTQDVGTRGTINTTGPFALTLPTGFQVWQSVPVILHHPFLFNFGLNEPANDNRIVPVRFERFAR